MIHSVLTVSSLTSAEVANKSSTKCGAGPGDCATVTMLVELIQVVHRSGKLGPMQLVDICVCTLLAVHCNGDKQLLSIELLLGTL